ncbi:ABC transporter ATP-binding protein [Azospirillum doebereinerae]|uniref:ABC transporter ATP-binding protein n=1 Tax=Azospirillum doebereinerae TaxID=92933 RepID=UPI001EE56BDF|nr:sn-glycerol-3-phosphate ABC transporter ATP-binding protein UgpC [Azospirillum doebereinerae]MCG5239477.1 sn-glycerol-3-phosphate ABC transporter ATP-binding protein UgpC [Azospirillum doebereinerae]
MATIALEKLVKRYGPATIVQGIDLSVAEGEFVVLVGPSGCGKSTTLRMIAGLEDASEGVIRIDGRVVNQVEPKGRNIAMVFQNYAIYPHVTVAENIGFGLYTSKLPKAEKQARIQEVARSLGLEALLDRRPAQLSGGQRQRVAIGRAMVRNPSAFLFDEPLSNLDAQLRGQMRIEIKRLHQKLGATSVFVTHDQVEAMTMADRIVVMREGRILQIGAPMELYERPVDVFTARFIGSPTMNLLPGALASRDGADGVALEDGDAFVRPPIALVGNRAGGGGPKVLLGVRPHDLVLTAAPDSAAFTLSGTVAVVETLGTETLVHVDIGRRSVVGLAPGRIVPSPGQRVTLAADPAALHLFDAATERAFPRPLLQQP